MSTPNFAAPQTNPFGFTSLPNWSKSSFADLDKDGDLDAFVGNSSGDFFYFKNTGTASSPSFAAPQTNPFGLINIGNWEHSSASFADIDNDGDLDIFAGAFNANSVVYFQNIGTASSPSFAAPQSNPFGFTSLYYWRTAFVDIDNDGDLDAFAGTLDGNIVYFKNTGTASSPSFDAPQTNAFGLINIGDHSSPSFADLDKDGDLDAFIGSSSGNIHYFQNIGTASSPSFAAPQNTPFGFTNVGSFSNPSFADLDQDGDLDAFVGNIDGQIVYFQNNSSNIDDFVYGTPNNDVLKGTASADKINGLAGNDNISGLAGNDTLNGGDGNDILNGGLGDDSMSGGAGNDTYYVDTAGDVVVESAASGTDRVISTISYTLAANVENLTLTGNAAINGTGNTLNNTIAGNNASNVLIGDAGNDNLSANGANDTLDGGLGNDILNGGLGDDSMSGGAGNDTYYVNTVNDVVVENAASGTDRVISTISYTLAANVENLTLTTTAALNGTGNSLNNTITGNGGSNVLLGEAGIDKLSGAAGDDILNGDAGNDVLTGGTGADDFVFDSGNVFSAATVGLDKIADFSGASGDDIILSKLTFSALTSTGGSGFSVASEFATVATDAAAATSNALIVYNSTNGSLFYNQNGSAAGLGTGAKFATVAGTPALSAGDFALMDDVA